LDRRQPAARSGLRGEFRQEVVTVRILDIRQRALEERAGVAGHLLQDAEKLAQRAETLVELTLHVRDQKLVLLEGGLELLAAGLLGRLLPPRLLEQLRLLGLALAELAHALLALLVVPGLPLGDQIEQLRERARRVLRLRRSRGDREAEHCGCNEAVEL